MRDQRVSHGVNTAAQNVDIIGPLLRRKYVVILFAIIGTGVGYLAFQQAEPVYESEARLMIWSQAPPTIVGEETFKQTISMETLSHTELKWS